MFLHGRIGQRQLAHALFARADRHGHAPAQLAVDLHHQLDRLLLERVIVRFRPGRVNDGLGMPQFVPERMTDMRHDGREPEHDEFKRLLAHRRGLR